MTTKFTFILVLLLFSSNGYGQQKGHENSLDGIITNLHNTYSAKYQLMDHDFVRRETPLINEKLARTFEKIIEKLEEKYHAKLSEMTSTQVENEQRYNLLEKKYELQRSEQKALKAEVERLKLQSRDLPDSKQRQARLLNQLPTTPPPITRPPSTRHKVAFYAQLSRDLASMGNNQVIVFNLATTNVGGHYNPNDGIFTAPSAGTYVFSWTAANNPHSYMQTELVVNGHMYGRTMSDAMDHDDVAIASNTVVLMLKVKDVVWIRSNSVHSRVLRGGQMSTFSGWLLYDQ